MGRVSARVFFYTQHKMRQKKYETKQSKAKQIEKKDNQT